VLEEVSTGIGKIGILAELPRIISSSGSANQMAYFIILVASMNLFACASIWSSMRARDMKMAKMMKK